MRSTPAQVVKDIFTYFFVVFVFSIDLTLSCGYGFFSQSRYNLEQTTTCYATSYDNFPTDFPTPDSINVSIRFYWFLLVGTYLYAALLVTVPCMLKYTRVTLAIGIVNLTLYFVHFIDAPALRFGLEEEVCSGKFLSEKSITNTRFYCRQGTSFVGLLW